ncbi:glycoside hydrolase family 130 protein [Luteolibacter soli]|uniref:Glycosidase n=1 Tax=Luteolibacter soli TaxID=3135280 RepID=A0ABU9AYR5_9BACT
MTWDPDAIVFSPLDVDLSCSPLRAGIDSETYVLGAFNPGFTRLPNGNLLMMVRIAEALKEPVTGNEIHAIRWDPQRGYLTDPHELALVDASDPRKFRIRSHSSKVMALTSLSWLLPVELHPDSLEIVGIHYDKSIGPAASFQEYGVEDARISKVENTWYMTTCSVSAERQCTTLYTSRDGLNYELQGIVLDHQNKDMLIFEGKPGGKFHALTRPTGDLYFAYPPSSEFEAGPSINLASSPDALHWKPADTPLIRPRRGSSSVMRIGGGTAPILTSRGWLMLYHGVQPGTVVGTYRTFHAFLGADDPARVLSVHDERPLLESRPDLTSHLRDLRYLENVVFTTGLVDGGDHFIVASGEDDLACRITRIPKRDLGLEANLI